MFWLAPGLPKNARFSVRRFFFEGEKLTLRKVVYYYGSSQNLIIKGKG